MIKEFFSLLKRYIKPYRKYLTWAVILNFLSQWLNVFSFLTLVPILNILFKIDTTKYEYIPMDIHNLNKDVLVNNGYYYINYIIDQYGAFITLVFMGLVLIFMTLLKTSGYFASSAVMVPHVPASCATSAYRYIIRCSACRSVSSRKNGRATSSRE